MSNDITPEQAAPPTAPASPASSVPIPETPTKPTMARSTRILAFTAGGVVAAAAVFGGGVAFGTSLNTGGSTAQQGQFGTPPGGTGGTGTAPNGTAPTGAPTGAPGGTTTG